MSRENNSYEFRFMGRDLVCQVVGEDVYVEAARFLPLVGIYKGLDQKTLAKYLGEDGYSTFDGEYFISPNGMDFLISALSFYGKGGISLISDALERLPKLLKAVVKGAKRLPSVVKKLRRTKKITTTVVAASAVPFMSLPELSKLLDELDPKRKIKRPKPTSDYNRNRKRYIQLISKFDIRWTNTESDRQEYRLNNPCLVNLETTELVKLAQRRLININRLDGRRQGLLDLLGKEELDKPATYTKDPWLTYHPHELY